MVIAMNFGTFFFGFDTTVVPSLSCLFSLYRLTPPFRSVPLFLANHVGGEAVSVADPTEEAIEGAKLEDSRRGPPVGIEQR